MATIKDWTLGILIKAKDEATGVFGGVTGALKGMAVAAAAYAGFDLFRDSIARAAAFEVAMDKVIAKTDDGRENAAKLADAARRIGPEFGASATEAAQGLEILGAAGLKADDAIKTLPAVLALAKAESIGLEQAAGLVTDSLSIMGLGFDQAGRAADVLVKGANLSNTSAADLGEALKYVGGEAVAAGLTLEKTTALLDALAAQGFKASQGGTSLRQALSDLINPTSKAREELLKLGVTTGDIDQALIAIKAAGAGGEAAIRALGIEGGAAVRKLIAELPNIARYEQGILGAGGAAKTAAEQVGGNLTGALNALSAIWEVVSQQLLEPVLEPLANGLRSLAANLREFAKDGLGELQSGFRSVTDTIGTVANALGENFKAGFDAAREAWTAFVGAFQVDTVKDDLSSVGTSVKGLADTIKIQLPSATTVGVTAASSLSAAWNGAASVLYTVSSGINKLLEYSTRFLATVEEQAAKVGLGSQERADALRRSAEEYAVTAADMAGKSVASYEQVKAALERLQAGITNADAAAAQATENTRLSADTYLNHAKTLESTAGKVAVLKTGYRELAQAGKDTTAIEQALAEALIQTATAQQVAADAAKGSIKTDQQVLDTKTQVLTATKETVARLKQEYEALKASGTASATEITLAFTRLETAQRYLAQQTGETSKEIIAAFERLGVESAQSLGKVADSAKKDFNTIKSSGTASVGELNAAFAAMAAKALEAAAAVSPLAVEIEKNKLSILAGTAQQREALDALIKKYQDVSSAADAAGETQTKSAKEVTDEVEKTTDAIDKQQKAADKTALSMDGIRLATVRLGNEMAVAFGDQFGRYQSIIARIDDLMNRGADAAERLSSAVQAGSTADYGPLLAGAADLAGQLEQADGYSQDLVNRIQTDLVRAIQDATAAMREFATEQARAAEEEALALERQQAAGDDKRLEEIEFREKMVELTRALAEAEAITDAQSRQRAIAAVQARIDTENQRHQLVMRNNEQAEETRTPSSVSTRREQTIQVNLTAPSGNNKQITVSEADAASLQQFLSSLEVAASITRRAA